jgi:glyoxylase-like metal-dependent hydrolase (beta-lactamase superfamily II)
MSKISGFHFCGLNCIKFMLLLLPLVTSCTSIHAPSYSGDTAFAKDSRLQSPEQFPDVALSIVKTAESKTLEAFFFSGGSWFKQRIASQSAILVRHPQGSILFDTGLGNHIDEQFKESMPFWLKPLMAYRQKASAQSLLADELTLHPVRRIILSHMHWDHASGIKDFPEAEVWATQAEYDWATGGSAPEGRYIQSQFSGKEINWHFIKFDAVPYENFASSLDVYKDGTVVLVPLPGHTPGAIGMFVNLRSGTRIFASGDTTWTVDGFKLPAHKMWMSSMLVDFDKRETELTIRKVNRLMHEYPTLLVVPTHDDPMQSKIGFFPSYLH